MVQVCYRKGKMFIGCTPSILSTALTIEQMERKARCYLSRKPKCYLIRKPRGYLIRKARCYLSRQHMGTLRLSLVHNLTWLRIMLLCVKNFKLCPDNSQKLEARDIS